MDKMTGAEFYAYVLREFKRTDKSTEVYEAITDTLINIRTRYPFDDFKTEAYTSDGIDVLGDYRLDLPSDFGHIISVRVLEDGSLHPPLIKLNKPQFDDLYPHPNDTDVSKGVPKHYCVYNNQILLGDVPDDITYLYEISYSTEEAVEIASSTTEIDFTDRYREMLRAGVLERLYEIMGADNLAIKWKSVYEEGLARMIERETNNADGIIQQKYCGI